MDSKNVLIVILVCILLYLAFTAGPIVYRGVFGIRGICSEQVNRYKKYGSEFVFTRVDEEMAKIGILVITSYSIHYTKLYEST